MTAFSSKCRLPGGEEQWNSASLATGRVCVRRGSAVRSVRQSDCHFSVRSSTEHEVHAATYTDAGLVDHTPTAADVTRIMKQFLGRYPVNSLDTSTQGGRTSFNPCLGLPAFPLIRKELNDWRNNDCRSGPCKDFYQGLLADQSSCVPSTGINGEGDLPGHASRCFCSYG